MVLNHALEEIKDDCYIVLDTNVLLAPYIIGKEELGKDDLLEECQRIYQSLTEQKRLIIPGQVAREFANRRVDKIGELYQQLSDKKAKIEQIPRGKYPLLNALSEYQQVEQLQDEINKKIREYQSAVNQVLAQIASWQLNDPVRSLYSQLFGASVILDPQFDKDEITTDLMRRQTHHIPPGYKDRGKEDSGVGDLLIWYTILELGKAHKKSVIFVSGDGKPDWFKQSQSIALHLRYELVDEFRRASEGQTFHVVKFSRFLELYGASDKLVEEVRQEEPLLTLQFGIDEDTGLPLVQEAYDAIFQWLIARYPDFTIFQYKRREIDFLIEERGRVRTAVKVIASNNMELVINRAANFFSIPGSIFDGHYVTHAMIINLTSDLLKAESISRQIMLRLDLPENVSFTSGYLDAENKFIALSDIIRRPGL